MLKFDGKDLTVENKNKYFSIILYKLNYVVVFLQSMPNALCMLIFYQLRNRLMFVLNKSPL